MEKKDVDKPVESNTIVYTIRWNSVKSARLKRIRGVSFEEIIQGKFLGIHDHPNRTDQKILAYEHKGYFWSVPFVYEEGGIFLKTLYPNRKYKKLYKKEK
ncbi:MAG: toxin [Candidatus Omnitrophica bacterium]|nr:toxin [Candidatus Omnitrophota bacterium]